MTDFLSSLKWRLIGPYRGGRVVAVAGDPRDRLTFYFGSTGGGVWKSTDAGISWRNVSDGFFKRASVGALAVAASDPNVIYAGMGECCIRNNVSHGDGMWRSVDAGRTWSHLGLEATRHIARVRVHPQDPELVYAAALGHAHGPNPERGVYRSGDGGRTWELVLNRGDDAGVADLAMDPLNPRILYAAFWQARRLPWRLDSAGPGSGLWRSADGGTTWEELTRKPGLPRGVLGRVGVTASGARAGRLWAIVEAEDGAVFRSDDYGDHWERLSEQRELRSRAWYYSHVMADPTDAETVWALNVEAWRSSDGGATFSSVAVQHGDCHDLWIDPRDGRRMILGDDGGASVSVDGGATWSSLYNQPTAELYHVTTDTREPYHVYAAQQDNSTIAFPSQSRLGAITQLDTAEVGGGESGYIAVRPDRPDIVYAGNYKGQITRFDRSTGEARPIMVWPEETAAAEEARYRFNWTAPIVLSPHDPGVLYQAGNRVFRSTDEGHTWEAISPDLSRDDGENVRPSGEITPDNSGAEYYCTVFALVESPLRAGLIWAGTDDGRVHVTRDAGRSWTDVTPPDLPEWATVRIIDASTRDADTAYVTADLHKLDDVHPYLWRTRDGGAGWQRLDAGLPEDQHCHVLREDPVRRGMLYCGTETGLWVSLDDGEGWHALRGRFPVVPVHDVVVKGDDLVVATHGRSIWVLEDLPALRQYDPAQAESPLHLFTPRTPVRYTVRRSLTKKSGAGRSYRHGGVASIAFERRPLPDEEEAVEMPVAAGENPTEGVTILYLLGAPGDDELRITVLDAAGNVVRELAAKPGDEERKDGDGGRKDPVPPRKEGLNRFVWDTRHAPGTVIEIDPPKQADAAANDGPMVPPGRYEVRVELGPARATAGFDIKADPRSAASQDDLVQEYELALEVWRRITDLYGAVNRLRSARRQLADAIRDAGGPDAEAGGPAREVQDALRDVESQLVADGGGERSVFLRESRLDTKYQRLRQILAVPGRPTASTLAVAADLSNRLDEVLARVPPLLEQVPGALAATRSPASGEGA
jgi:photosystem II stability/assembly factor-like uncharacterized protein